MEMFSYNPKRKNESNIGWQADIGTGPLRVKNENIKKEYIVDGFVNKTKCDFDEEDIWYSFDPESGNFHIVPGTLGKGMEKLPLGTKLGNIRREVKGKELPGITVAQRVSTGTAKNGCDVNHKYFFANSKENEYLMSFNRLWCADKADGIHICNNFGQAQFMCFPVENDDSGEAGQINMFPDEDKGKYRFELMYPRSGEDGDKCTDCKSTHFVFNAPYDINCDAKKIADCFVDFINWCEKSTKCKSNKLCEGNENCKEKSKEKDQTT